MILMTALLLSLQTDVSLDGRWRGRELSISGKARGLPEGTALVLRFRKVVVRIEECGGGFVSRPLETAWDRKIPVEKGAFHHREPAGPSVELEVEAVLVLPSGEERTERVRRFRAPPSVESIRELRKGAREMAAAVERVRSLISAPGAARIEEARRSVRTLASSSPLSATADLLESFLSDLERLRESDPAGARPLSSISGEPLTFDGARDRLRWIEEVAERERRLALVREAREVAREILARTESGDVKSWNRASGALDRTLGALVDLARSESDDEFKRLVGGVERLFELAPSAVECPSSVGPEWRELVGRLEREGEALEGQHRAGDSP